MTLQAEESGKWMENDVTFFALLMLVDKEPL